MVKEKKEIVLRRKRVKRSNAAKEADNRTKNRIIQGKIKKLKKDLKSATTKNEGLELVKKMNKEAQKATTKGYLHKNNSSNLISNYYKEFKRMDLK